MNSLTRLDVGENNLVSKLPTELGNLPGMYVLSLDSNGFTGTLPTEFSVMSVLDIFDVSNNQLAGTVPPEYGSWRGLNRLSLDGNNLTGSMPQPVCELRQAQCDNGYCEYSYDIVQTLTVDCGEITCGCCTNC